MASEEDPVQADLKSLKGMAKRLGLEGKDADKYVDEHMTGLGHQRVTSYAAGKKDGDDGKKRSRFSPRSGDDDWDD